MILSLATNHIQQFCKEKLTDQQINQFESIINRLGFDVKETIDLNKNYKGFQNNKDIFFIKLVKQINPLTFDFHLYDSEDIINYDFSKSLKVLKLKFEIKELFNSNSDIFDKKLYLNLGDFIGKWILVFQNKNNYLILSQNNILKFLFNHNDANFNDCMVVNDNGSFLSFIKKLKLEFNIKLWKIYFTANKIGFFSVTWLVQEFILFYNLYNTTSKITFQDNQPLTSFIDLTKSESKLIENNFLEEFPKKDVAWMSMDIVCSNAQKKLDKYWFYKNFEISFFISLQHKKPTWNIINDLVIYYQFIYGIYMNLRICLNNKNTFIISIFNVNKKILLEDKYFPKFCPNYEKNWINNLLSVFTKQLILNNFVNRLARYLSFDKKIIFTHYEPLTKSTLYKFKFTKKTIENVIGNLSVNQLDKIKSIIKDKFCIKYTQSANTFEFALPAHLHLCFKNENELIEYLLTFINFEDIEPNPLYLLPLKFPKSVNNISKIIDIFRNLLENNGFNEVKTFSLIASGGFQNEIKLVNPNSLHHTYLRPSLLTSAKNLVDKNIKQYISTGQQHIFNQPWKLYEISKIHLWNDSQSPTKSNITTSHHAILIFIFKNQAKPETTTEITSNVIHLFYNFLQKLNIIAHVSPRFINFDTNKSITWKVYLSDNQQETIQWFFQDQHEQDHCFAKSDLFKSQLGKPASMMFEVDLSILFKHADFLKVNINYLNNESTRIDITLRFDSSPGSKVFFDKCRELFDIIKSVSDKILLKLIADWKITESKQHAATFQLVFINASSTQAATLMDKIKISLKNNNFIIR